MIGSSVPDGHPGDAAWRLPVWRTLLKLKLVKPEQLEPVNALAKQGGFFTSHLAAMGVNPDKLLTTVAMATGLPSAPRHEVRRPKAELGEGLDGALLRGLLASPFRKDAGLLHLAFVVPMPKERLVALPPHKAYVALESDVRDGLDALFPAKKKDGPVPAFDPFLVDLPPPPSAPPVPAPKARGPSAEDLKRAGLVETHVTGREELFNSVARLKWVGAGILALGVLVKGASVVIRYSQNEAEKKGAELHKGIAQAAVRGAPSSQDEVFATMAALDVATRGKDVAAFYKTCTKLAQQLRAYAPFASTANQTMRLANVAGAVTAMCERENPNPGGEWGELRGMINRAMTGD